MKRIPPYKGKNIIFRQVAI